ncbi:MAG: carboxypeptidase-like regulatory domain-containing protein [Bacteroidaceae bacterium]|nr:carboxypeptidase-like regulatory domain-containing protein [Bacteroidaceae bacterium]
MRQYLVFLITTLLLTLIPIGAFSQIRGRVVDAKTRKPLEGANVYYEGKNVGGQTDNDGAFVIPEAQDWHELTISSMGYKTQVVKLKSGQKSLTVRLQPDPRMINEVTVEARKTKYSRKNNPAVELMRKVIASKKFNSLESHDFYFYTKYEKMTFSVNEFSDQFFEEGDFKQLSFLRDHAEVCEQTGKTILPLTVDEMVSDIFYRKRPESKKQLIKGEVSKGVQELFNTGEIVTATLKDVFTDVDIYQNECRLLQFPFKSPIADNAINFYRYYLMDTLYVEDDKVVEVGFTPNNPQDFGFSGSLFIMLDSTWQVRSVELNIPRRSDVNFVENMVITQHFETLPTGDRVVTVNDMLIELKLVKWVSKFQVQKTVRYNDFSFDPISPKVFKRIKGTTFKDPDANMKEEDFWNEYRKVELTDSEGKMDSFIKKIERIKGFKYFIFVFKALVENFVETSDSLATNKVDIGPVNTMISQNNHDKLRLRFSALTTAHLHEHLFADGYLAYGTKTDNFYGKAHVTYSFNKKAYLPREFPQNNLSAYYMDDITSPFDKYIHTDKDNMFISFHASDVNHLMHTKEWGITYDKEWYSGLKAMLSLVSTIHRPVEELFYQRIGTGPSKGRPVKDPSYWLESIHATEFKAGFSFEPGATYINTKQRRRKINLEAPVFYVSHTFGLNNVFGGDYEYNLTEASVYKRFWVGTWGKVDSYIKGGVQWNVVPFPFLIHPAANQSYILEDETFNLISNYEFLNDRYVSAMISWDLNGKLFNRIPLLKKLKWREYFGLNMLWGTLTDKNNPYKSGDSRLFYFPGHFRPDGTYYSRTHVMDPDTPYLEAIVGIHNIFKLLHVEYVRRLTYLDHPNTHRNGIRFMIRMTF